MPCEISDEARSKLTELLRVLSEDDAGWKPLLEELSVCHPCAKTLKITGTAQPAVSKTGRKLSAYQVFLSSCMKPVAKGGKGQSMVECVEDWKAQKGKGG